MARASSPLAALLSPQDARRPSDGTRIYWCALAVNVTLCMMCYRRVPLHVMQLSLCVAPLYFLAPAARFASVTIVATDAAAATLGAAATYLVGASAIAVSAVAAVGGHLDIKLESAADVASINVLIAATFTTLCFVLVGFIGALFGWVRHDMVLPWGAGAGRRGVDAWRNLSYRDEYDAVARLTVVTLVPALTFRVVVMAAIVTGLVCGLVELPVTPARPVYANPRGDNSHPEGGRRPKSEGHPAAPAFHH